MSTKWKVIKLIDYCDKVTVGHVGSMADRYVPNGIPLFRSLNIKPFTLSFDNLVFIDKEFNRQLKKSELKPGDVVVIRTGYPGVACVIPENFEIANCSDLVIIRPSKKLDPHFLAAIFNSSWGKQSVEGSTVGAAQQHFNIGTAKNMRIQLPDIHTQQKIGSIIKNFSDLIEINQQRIRLLEDTARQLYREWFVRLRFPGWKEAKMVKGVPEGWEVKSLSEIVKMKMGQSPESKYYNETGIGLPFHQGVGNYGPRYPEHKVFCSIDGRTANPGDILFSVRAPVGRLNISDQKIIIGRGLAAMNHKRGLNSFLYYLLQNEFSKEDIIGNGSIFNSVGKDELEKFKVFDPGVLADKFDHLIKPFDEQLKALDSQNTYLRQIRDRLLPRLVSGKLAVGEVEPVTGP